MTLEAESENTDISRASLTRTPRRPAFPPSGGFLQTFTWEGGLWKLRPGFGHLQPCQLPSGQQHGQQERVGAGGSPP